jgi:hypothetical protein
MYIDEADAGIPLVDLQGKTNAVIRMPRSGSYRGNKDDRVRVVQTKRVARVSFEWDGKEREVTDEEVLSETRKLLVKKESWEEQP